MLETTQEIENKTQECQKRVSKSDGYDKIKVIWCAKVIIVGKNSLWTSFQD